MSVERTSIHNPRYRALVARLVDLRRSAGKSQSEVAEALELEQPDISKIENYERRIDALEFLNWLEFVAEGAAHEIRRAIELDEPDISK